MKTTIRDLAQVAWTREQYLVDLMFSMVLTVNRGDTALKNDQEAAAWVAKQLRLCGFDTVPVGSSWGKLKKDLK